MVTFFRRKKLTEENQKLVQEQLSLAEGLTPLEAYVDTPAKEIPELCALIKQWIDDNRIEGNLTSNGDAFVPKKAILEVIEHELEEGKLNVPRLSRRLRLSIKYVKQILKSYLVSLGIDGFWDINGRTFFTQKGAKRSILDLERGLNLRHLRVIAGELGWSPEHVLGTLESMAEDGSFRGFLDVNGLIHETTALRVDILGGGEKASELLVTFCKGTIRQRGYASLLEVAGVFNLEKHEAITILENETFRATTKSSFRVTRVGDVIYNPIPHLKILFRILLTHRIFPVSYLAERTGLPLVACQDMLEAVFVSIPCMYLEEGMTRVEGISHLVTSGIVLKNMAQKLSIPQEVVVKQFSDSLSLGKNYVWLKKEHLSVSRGFSFVCNSENTRKYYPEDRIVICLNCGNQECMNCFSSHKNKGKCSQCGVVGAFLLEFPRECPKCSVAFNEASSLLDHRFCPICYNITPEPLELRRKQKTMTHDLETLLSYTKSAYSTKNLAEILKCSQKDVIPFIEDLILGNFPAELAIEVEKNAQEPKNVTFDIRLIKIAQNELKEPGN